MKYLSTFVLLLALNGCALHSTSLLPRQNNKQLEQLSKEREKLKRQTNPVDRTKTDIKISEILLTFVGDAVKQGDFELMEARLDEYLAVIQDAHQTMMNTKRDAHSKPGGFKDLEIALRRQLRQLEDLGGALAFDQRDPVERVREEASDIRDALIKALFGGQNAPPVKS